MSKCIECKTKKAYHHDTSFCKACAGNFYGNKKQKEREVLCMVELTRLITQWADDRSLLTANPAKQAIKLGEEFGEVCEGLAKGNAEMSKDGIGDMYVVLVILAEQLGFTMQECVETAYNEIKNRQGKMVNGTYIKEEDLTNE